MAQSSLHVQDAAAMCAAMCVAMCVAACAAVCVAMCAAVCAAVSVAVYIAVCVAVRVLGRVHSNKSIFPPCARCSFAGILDSFAEVKFSFARVTGSLALYGCNWLETYLQLALYMAVTDSIYGCNIRALLRKI